MKARPMMNRLEAVFDIVPTADVIADIGTDHGYLAVELVMRGKAKRVIAEMYIKALFHQLSPILNLEGLVTLLIVDLVMVYRLLRKVN